MPVDAILFDKDGTLIDFDLTWGPAAWEVMRALAGDDPGKLAALTLVSEYIVPERRFLPTSPLVAGSSATYGPLWAEALGREPGPALYREIDDLFREHGLRSLAPIGQPRTVLALLRRRGLSLGIATNDAHASAIAQADALGISDCLCFVAGYDSGFGSKPAPGMVTAFAEHLAIAPERVALVGDSLHDLHAARAAGALAVAVLSGPRGPAAREELAPHADLVIDTVADLPSLLDRLPAP